jgi:hypothetical protein
VAPAGAKNVHATPAQSRSTSLDIQHWRGLARIRPVRPTELSTESVDRIRRPGSRYIGLEVKQVNMSTTAAGSLGVVIRK